MDMGSPDEVARAYGEFVGHMHPASEPPQGFRDWVQNLHDVYLNVETAGLASLYIPASVVEEQLDRLGASRRRRLARFVARDMWVLWEAWKRRPLYHAAFEERAPAASARLRALEELGKSLGWFKRMRNVRDYMNHRDQRDYSDPGRESLPDEAIEWMDDLRRAFSDLLLAAMGMPRMPTVAGALRPEDLNSTTQEIAVAAVDDFLVGTLAATGSGLDPDTTAVVLGHLGRAFTQVASASPPVWSECLTALIRRSIIAWCRLDELPELQSAAEPVKDFETSGS